MPSLNRKTSPSKPMNPMNYYYSVNSVDDLSDSNDNSPRADALGVKKSWPTAFKYSCFTGGNIGNK